MAIAQNELEAILKQSFRNDEINIIDLRNDQDHYSVEIISDQFKGLSRLKRQQLVLKALGDLLEERLHAITIQTKTKEEVQNV